MLNKCRITNIWSLLLAIGILILASTIWAPPLHSVVLTVPDHPEEALNWCGPATGKMIMEGYPSGSCSVLQEDIWLSIQSNKAESVWDTDPVGLKEAMKHLCPASWSVFSNTDPQAFMHSVAYYMTKYKYPVAGLLNTVSHNAYAAHEEHWVAIRGIITDKDPTLPGNTSVNLQFVWFNDPSPANLGDPSVERFASGSTWYNEFQPVTKAGSSYLGKYVAIIEPPEIKGRAIAPVEVLVGKIINPEDALKYAAKWIEEYKLYDVEPYKLLRRAKPLIPFLVNKNHGGYYIIPYTVEAKRPLADAALIINAYTGNFQEVGTFKPVAYMPKEEAISIALKYLTVEKPKKVDAELIFPIGEQTVSRYFPIWKVTVNRKVLGVGSQGKIYTKIPREEFSIPLPGIKPQGITWDGKYLWAIDERTKKLNSFDPRSGAVIRSFDINLKRPKGLMFDGKALWVADEETKIIYAVNPESSQIVKTIKMEIPQEKGFKSFEGITWDGKYLWTAYFAGFSSSFNQIDTESGRIVRSIFADCNPRGIASDGEYIWSICYNGENLPPKIDRRKILEKEHEMLRSRVFIRDIEEKDPSGLAYDGQYLWYTDRLSKRTFRLYPGGQEEK